MANWTKEQEQVINLRNRNLLVSAAAGSGKTAVLVERIVKIVTDKENPVDIDRLVVVTFTKAAAAEMKERILGALTKALDENPDDRHIQRQISLVHTAKITTIDSFCMDIVRNNFDSIDIDPSFRIGDEGELKLLSSDVIADMLEDYYEQSEDDFIDFVETYSKGNNDSNLEDLIMKLYRFSVSYPWPEEWLNMCIKVYQVESVEELAKTDIMKGIYEYVKNILKDMKRISNRAISLCGETNGPADYIPAIESDRIVIDKAYKADGIIEMAEIINQYVPERMKAIRSKEVDPYLKDKAKLLRDEIKGMITSIKNDFFQMSFEEMTEDIAGSRNAVTMLVKLVLDFSRRFAAKKKEKNIIDFNDMSHYALDILVGRNEDGEIIYSKVADELSENYDEILIDEYQDSNLVQEMILNSVSTVRFGRPNVFMVGDVKQSIYKFRLARPEMFMEKYNTYTTTDSPYQKIELHKNFRSRGNVLKSINYIFYKIMKASVGNVEYTRDAALFTGAEYPENPDENFLKTKVLLLDTSTKSISEEAIKETSDEEELSTREQEARLIANEINKIVKNKTQVRDKASGEMREIKYSDIVVLLRSMSGYAETFMDVFNGAGIPTFSESQSGYFSAIEVENMLNFLSIIDNPLQDIPFTAVLKSPFVGLDVNQLSEIRTVDKKAGMYACCKRYLETGSDETVKGLIQKLFVYLEDYEKRKTYTDIHILIKEIADETGYYNYISAMPAGLRRKGNIDMLIEKARAYEKTSYRGLFNFIRYIEKLKKYNVDFGEAAELSENDDTVRLISIHKSKGLEFPVVFVAACGKNFNKQDTMGKIVIHPDLGIGTDCIDYNLRIKSPTIYKNAIAKQIVNEMLGEELRILYVALTRAKEKLYITGVVKDMEKALKKWISTAEENPDELSYMTRTKAGTYLDYIMPAILTHKDIKNTVSEFVPENELIMCMGKEDLNSDADFSIEYHNTNSLIKETVKEEVVGMAKREMLYDMLSEEGSGEIYEEIDRRLNFIYSDIIATKIYSKMSVSEIKKMGQAADFEESQVLYEDSGNFYQDVYEEGINEETANGETTNEEETIQEEELLMPAFLSEKQEVSGSQRGTAYHKFLELLDYTKCVNTDMIKLQMQEAVQNKKMPESYPDMINPFDILYFVKSDVGQRMKKAYENNCLYREKQFVMSVPYSEIDKDYTGEETILIQGIIDAFFEEDGKIILVDYKTDKVNEPEELISRYKVQLDFYEKAVNKVNDLAVSEKIIYSFALKTDLNI